MLFFISITLSKRWEGLIGHARLKELDKKMFVSNYVHTVKLVY
jgi:hypothetical protein